MLRYETMSDSAPSFRCCTWKTYSPLEKRVLVFIGILAFITLGVLIGVLMHSYNARCKVVTTGQSTPLVVLSGTNTFLYPNPGEDSIKIPIGETVDVACPGGTISVQPSVDSLFQGVCESGSTFSAADDYVDLSEVTCSKYPVHTARYTQQSCEENGKEVEIGYQINKQRFVRQIRLCFDDSLLIAKYSEYNLTSLIGARVINVTRTDFIPDNFYSFNVTAQYQRTTQRTTINNLLGLPETSTEYIKDNGLSLSRGHYTAKADFVFGYQQLATFHYINVGPQWKSFNEGKWNSIEIDVRDYAKSKAIDLRVITGVYGVATLPHKETKKDVELYLAKTENGKGILPVPKLFWKVVYSEKLERGVAIVGVNNPYETDSKKSLICEDISHAITWISWKSQNEDQYFMYACSIDDLRNKIKSIPELKVTDLLY